MKRFLIDFFLILMILAIATMPAFSEAPANKQAASLGKTAIIDLEVVDGNNLYNFLNNRGAWGTHNNSLGYSTFWPGADGENVNFAAGVWVAGMVNGDIRTAASEFTYEFQPGIILPDGTPDDQSRDIHQILKINKADLLDEGATNPDYDLWVNEAYQYGAPVLKNIDGSDSLSASGKRIPALIGDQMLWMVYNDADPGSHGLYQTDPIGLEVHNTIWVFNRPDEFGDMMFVKFLLVNKGQSAVNDCYIGLFFDVDLGDSNDDLCFCDTTLSLGAFWNDGSDTHFDIPPAVGADFFQGPIVPSAGDTAYVSGREITGYTNLGMTSFSKFIRNGPVDAQDPENAQEAYNFMKGLNGLGQPIIDPTTNQPTKFVNISDPEANTGWVDGVDLNSADRRMLMNTGPFTLEKWQDSDGDGIPEAGEVGVQEIVAGFMVSQGTGAKNSTTRLKMMDEKAQLAYDLNFALPPSPGIPDVTVHPLDEAVVLTWEDNAEDYKEIDRVATDEDGNPTYYRFQGYNLYQSDTPVVGPNTTLYKLATFDLVDGITDIQDQVFSEEYAENITATVQRAGDSGIQRFIRLETDATRNGERLRNWNPYWFIVQAYGYNAYGIPKILKSPLSTIEAVPKPLQGGLQTAADFNDLIAAVSGDTAFNASHSSAGAMSDGQIEVYAIDPAMITGQDYVVTFEKDQNSGQIVWNLDRVDTGSNTRLLSNQTNQSGDDAYMIVDGMLPKVMGPPNDFRGMYQVANANGPITPPDASFPQSENIWWYTWLDFINSDDGYFPVEQAQGGFFFLVAGGRDITTHEDALPRVSRDGSVWSNIIPCDWEIRFTAEGSKGYNAFTDGSIMDVPFELWNIGIGTPDDPGDDYRVIPWILDNNENQVFDMYGDHEASSGADDPASDWIYFRLPADTSPGESGYLAFENSVLDGDYSDADYDANDGGIYALNRLMLMNWNMNGGADSTALPETGTVYRIVTNKTNQPADQFTFATNSFLAAKSAKAAEDAVKNINVYPNPYFGQNPAEVDPITRFVTFTHLSEQGTTCRIFTLSGDLIRSIGDEERREQGTLGSNTAIWDLRNKYDVPVASGMYIVHVDIDGIGSKVLKIAVFMPEERLDKF
ncbi:hypothetical protein GF407_07190 [candidate division KSB1 bacterium]|nr:hypothetical protein [candidate division KSB1 bacterium]